MAILSAGRGMSRANRCQLLRLTPDKSGERVAIAGCRDQIPEIETCGRSQNRRSGRELRRRWRPCWREGRNTYLNWCWCRKNSGGGISSRFHKMSFISTSCAQRTIDFALARCASQHAFFKTHSRKIHGHLPKLSATAARMVSFLCAAVRWGRTISLAEGLSAGVVLEFAVCIVAIGAAWIFAGRRAVVAPRECKDAAVLRERMRRGSLHVRA